MTTDTYLSHRNGGGAVNGFQQSVAVVVGIDDYGHGIPPLRTAVADATRLADLLETQHGYVVHRLTEDVHQARLRSFFGETLPTLLTADDRLLLYFAGHGVALDGEDGPAGYLIPQDARPEDPTSFLSMLDVHAALDALPCRHMLAIFDCCFAGAFRWASMRSLRPMPETIHKERYDRFIQHPAWQVITSASYDEEALDILRGDVLGRREEDGSHSPFAAALFAALEGEGDLIPKGEGDGVITAAELHLYLRNTVELQAEQFRHRQTPGIWPLHKHDKGEYIFLVPGYGELDLPPAPPLNLENNPYKGLSAYDSSRKDARLFFGREELENELAARVAERPFTVVLGASGTGKSSLVKAGVLPRLAGWHQEDATDDDAPPTWPIRHEGWVLLQPLRPTANPLRALEHALRQQLSLPDAQELADALDGWFVTHPEHKLLLTIDQFEELITLCRSDDEREDFQRLLARLIANHPDHLRVVLTLRSDFEPQFAVSPLAGLWTQDERLVVPPMDQDDLRRAIEGPASERVLYFEPPELVDQLINEVIQMPGALPLLSFTLSELYIRYVESESDNRALTEEHYRSLGRVVGSLRTSAEREFEALDPAHQATMQRVMLRMVAVEGGEIARRRVPRSELVYASEEENARVVEVLRRLVAARLVVTGRDDNGEEFVEPAHDALVRAWDRMLVWKREADEYLPLQRRVAQAAQEWVKAVADGESGMGLLWNNNPRLPQLKSSIENADHNSVLNWLNHAETEFVVASFQRAQVLKRRLWIAVGAVVISIFIAAVVVTNLRSQAAAAVEREELAVEAKATEEALRVTAEVAQAQEAVARKTAEAAQRETEELKDFIRGEQLAAEVQTVLEHSPLDASLASMLARESIRTTWRPGVGGSISANVYDASLSVLLAAPPLAGILPTARHTSSVIQGNFDRTGKRLITASHDTTAVIWEKDTGQIEHVLVGHEHWVWAAQFSPDGNQVATAGEDGLIILWDVESASQVRVFEDNGGAIYAIDFDETGDYIASGGEDGIVRVWNIRTGALRKSQKLHDGAVRSVAFHPNQALVLSSSLDGTAQTWDLNRNTVASLFVASASSELWSAEFSPDGRQVVTGDGNGVSRVWDLATGKEIASFAGERAQVFSVDFAPNGEQVVSTERTGGAVIWDIDTEREVARMEGHNGVMYDATFDPSGSQLLTASGDGSAILWDLSQRTQLTSYAGHSANITNIAISHDNQLLASSDELGVTLIWDVETAKVLHRLHGHTSGVNAIVIGPNNDIIVTAGNDNVAIVWDLHTGALIKLLQHENSVSDLLFFSLAHRTALATIDWSGNLRYWDADSWNQLGSYDLQEERVSSIAYSPKMDALAIATANGRLFRWDIKTAQVAIEYAAYGRGFTSVQFSPTTNQLVSAGYDSTAVIWNAETGEQLQVLEHPDIVWLAEYNQFGDQIVTVAEDGATRLWDINSESSSRIISIDSFPVRTGAMGPNAKQFATASTNGSGSIVKFWHIEPFLLEPIQIPCNQPDYCSALSVQVSQKGGRLASVNDEGSIQVWTRDDISYRPTVSINSPETNDIALAETRDLLAAAAADGTVRIWEPEFGQQLQILSGHTGPVNSVEFSKDGSLVGSAGADTTARIWALSEISEPIVLRPHESAVLSISFSSRPAHRVATTTMDGVIRLWNIDTMSVEKSWRGHECNLRNSCRVWSAQFSPDGSRLVTTGDDGTVRIWDSNTGRQLALSTGHDAPVRHAAFSSDGRKVVSTGEDNTVKLWNSVTGAEVADFVGHECNYKGRCSVNQAAFELDGITLITAGSDGMLRRWLHNPDVILASLEQRIDRTPPVFSNTERRRFSFN